VDTLTPARKELIDYIKQVGGLSYIREADNTYNDLNRNIIEAIKVSYGTAYLLNINYGKNEGDTQDEVLWTEYTGQVVCNFDYVICVPGKDEILENLISRWRYFGNPKTIPKIISRVETLDGESLTWF